MHTGLDPSERLARRSLRADALYCAVAGMSAIGARRRLAEVLGVPRPAVAGAGAATLVWAGVVAALARAAHWRRATTTVAAANTVASAALGAGALAHDRRGARVLLGALSCEVAAFGVSQVAALRR